MIEEKMKDILKYINNEKSGGINQLILKAK